MAVLPTPLVSVLVTARDNERHVGVALKSVVRQTLRSLELHVADDGSRDSTPDIVESLRDDRIRLTRFEESCGISTRRNELLEGVRGRYVAPLDADDVWVPERLARHIDILEARPDLVAVGSDVLTVDEGVRVGSYFRLPRSDAAVRWSCLFTSPLIHSACTIRAAAFEDGIRYDPSFPLAQDYDLWTKLLKYGGAENIATPLTLYRVHPMQATSRRAAERRDEQEIIGCRTIEEVAGSRGLDGDRARLAWCLGADVVVATDELEESIDAYRDLLACFVAVHRDQPGLGEVRRIAATALLRQAGRGLAGSAWALRRAALRIDPAVAVSSPAVKTTNLFDARRYRRRACRLLEDLEVSAGSKPRQAGRGTP